MDTSPLSGQPIWSFERAQRHWTGQGARQLLDQPLTAFFASRKCPGTAIRTAMDWALAQASARRAVVGGFHSPLEQSVLHLLLEARSPVVAVLTRPVVDARLKPEWECVRSIRSVCGREWTLPDRLMIFQMASALN